MPKLQDIADVLALHHPIDISGGSDDNVSTIFCGGQQWHRECSSWADWDLHVAEHLAHLEIHTDV